MRPAPVRAASPRELVAAVAGSAPLIEVTGELTELPTLRLARGQVLRAAEGGARLGFSAGNDGIGLAGENEVTGVAIETDPARRAIFVTTSRAQPAAGRIALRDLLIAGQLECRLDGDDRIDALDITRVHLRAADTIARTDRPQGNGVACLQGAITVWNRIPGHELRLAIEDVSIGAPDAPVRGGGVFIAGTVGPGGSRIWAQHVRIGAVYCDSTLPASETGVICGGTFVLPGARVVQLESSGPQVSFGANAVPIDNWGEIDEWIVGGAVTTHGPNAVAIVNAGRLGRLEVRAGVETFGDGARACAVYGPAALIRLASVTTHGAGAAGIHIVSEVGRLEVPGLLTIRGRSGAAMVKGQIETLAADGVHIGRAGRVGSVAVPCIELADPAGMPVRDDRGA